MGSRMTPEMESFNPSLKVRVLEVMLNTYQGARRHRQRRPQPETSSHKNLKYDWARVILSDINTSRGQRFEKLNIVIRTKSPFIYHLPISLDDTQTQAYRFRLLRTSDLRATWQHEAHTAYLNIYNTASSLVNSFISLVTSFYPKLGSSSWTWNIQKLKA
jgi:hypothetical protein